MFKKKKPHGLETLVAVARDPDPWYSPAPTTVIITSDHGTVQYYVKEDTDVLLGKLKDLGNYYEDDKFLVCLDVEDYTADQVWIRIDHIVAVIKNKQKPSDGV